MRKFKITGGVVSAPLKVVLYGVEGIGKSSFAARFPQPVFIDTEGGTGRLDVQRLPAPDSWQMLLDEAAAAADGQVPCQTLVLDTADWAEKLCMAGVCARFKVKGIEDIGYGKGYTYVKEEFARLLDVLEKVIASGRHVVVVAHAAVAKFEQPDAVGSYDRWVMKTSKQVAPLLREWCDMLLFANYKTVVEKSGSGPSAKNKASGARRVLYTTHNACWDAKNRFGLPDEVPFDYESIRAIVLNNLGSREKNMGLEEAARALLEGEDEILNANEEDCEKAAQAGMSQGLLDRLRLTPARVNAMADGLLQVAALEDPVGEVLSMKQRPNGLMIGKKRVPLGVIAMIYEARPNVTADAFGLCFKSGNAVILKGGSDAICSNRAIVKCLREGLERAGLPEDAVQLVEDTSRDTTKELMRLNEYVDVLIPRGGAGLIRTVVENSTVPVIETGTGNCHIYVDETADLNMALDIIYNAKTQRIGVCNACESLVVHRLVAEEFLPMLKKRLKEKEVEIRADEDARVIEPDFKAATEEDWGKEYLDYILSLKIVDSIDEAIAHINRYNTGHSDAIITSNYFHAQQFLNEIDAAAVYVNASTRFTDGEEFGFGAEIGISTQKLHARGPMGLKELTTTKYIIYGDGQIR